MARGRRDGVTPLYHVLEPATQAETADGETEVPALTLEAAPVETSAERRERQRRERKELETIARAAMRSLQSTRRGRRRR